MVLSNEKGARTPEISNGVPASAPIKDFNNVFWMENIKERDRRNKYLLEVDQEYLTQLTFKIKNNQLKGRKLLHAHMYLCYGENWFTTGSKRRENIHIIIFLH